MFVPGNFRNFGKGLLPRPTSARVARSPWKVPATRARRWWPCRWHSCGRSCRPWPGCVQSLKRVAVRRKSWGGRMRSSRPGVSWDNHSAYRVLLRVVFKTCNLMTSWWMIANKTHMYSVFMLWTTNAIGHAEIHPAIIGGSSGRLPPSLWEASAGHVSERGGRGKEKRISRWWLMMDCMSWVFKNIHTFCVWNAWIVLATCSWSFFLQLQTRSRRIADLLCSSTQEITIVRFSDQICSPWSLWYIRAVPGPLPFDLWWPCLPC